MNPYVAVAFQSDSTQQIMTSTDQGVTWTGQSSVFDGSGPLGKGGALSIAWDGTQFCTLGINAVAGLWVALTSPDGVAWTPHAIPQPLGFQYNDLIWANGQFVGLDMGSHGAQKVITSPDGVTWADSATLPDNAGWFALAFGAGLYVAVGASYPGGSGTQIVTSPDAIIWTPQTPPSARGIWLGVCFGGGQFVAVANSTSVTIGHLAMTSPDGIVWTLQTTSSPDHDWSDVAYDGTKYVMVADAGALASNIATSPNAIAWTSLGYPDGNHSTRIRWLDNQFVVARGSDTTIGGNSEVNFKTILTSPDGLAWTTRTTAIVNHVYDVAFGEPTFTLVISGGGTLTPASIGAPYSHTFPVTGLPVLGRVFSISAGSLPPGLSLDPATGIVTGVPTLLGTYTFTVTVTAPGGSASVSASLTIYGPIPGQGIAAGGIPQALYDRGRGGGCQKRTPYDDCLEREADRLRLIKFGKPCSIPEEYLCLLPWDDTFGAIPPQAVPFLKQHGIVTPTTLSGDTQVVSFRVPYGFDGLLSGFYLNYSGTGFAQGSGDILWRLQVNQYFLKDLSNVSYLLGDPVNPVPMTEGKILQSGQTVRALVNVPNLSGLIQIGSSTVYAGLLGFWWPR